MGASALSQIPFTRISPRILIVDDEPESIRLLVAFLRDRYPDVMVARDGFDGLQKAAKGLPDVILLDMSMPGLSGLDVCRRLKLERHLASIPVIFLTAHTSVEEKLAAFDAGAVDYVTKPFSDREVLARVAVHAASARAVNQTVSQPPPVDPWMSQSPQDRDDELLRTACEHLRQHLSSAPSVAELAAALRTSAFKLDGLFQKRLGLSVFEYSMELRLTVARQMLLETDAQIKRVAWTVGYANPGDLSRAFHRRFGLAPRAFRASRERDAC